MAQESSFPEPPETTARALGQQGDGDEMEGTGKKTTAKGKAWEGRSGFRGELTSRACAKW